MTTLREYNQEKLAGAMDADGLDVVIASSPCNVSYLSGVSIDYALLTFLVTTRDGRQGLVINEADAYFMRNDTNVGDVRDYPYSDTTAIAASKSIDQLVAMIHDMGLTEARIGLEEDFLPSLYREQLAEMLPDAVISNGAPAMAEARIYKTASELEVIRKAAHFTDKAIYMGFAHARPGDTERDIANAMQSYVLRYGATQLSHTVCSAGLQSTVVHCHPLDKPVQKGETIHVDFGGRFDGYQTDLSRTAVVGQPNAQQRDIYGKLWEIQQFLYEIVRPGAVAKEIFLAAEREFEKRGIVYPWGTLGHSTGLLVHEGFEITRTCERVIEAGMVLNLEPTHIEPGDARYHIEDTVLVHEDRVEVLSNYYEPSEMYVIL